MTKLCLQCQGLYVQETVECPWCESPNLIPMSEEQYEKIVLNIEDKNETEYPEPIDYLPIGTCEGEWD